MSISALYKSTGNIHLKSGIVQDAKKIFELEIEALQLVQENIGYEFEVLVQEILNCTGRVVITGMGKSGHVGRKISATMSSLGIPSYFLHPGEGVHGDLGMVTKDDVVIAISNSGETEEIISLIPSIKRIGAKLVSITGKLSSRLASHSEIKIKLKILREACNLNLAPTSSTTAALVFGDALAIVVSKLKGFRREDYAIFHPQGSLGKKLLIKVSDLMHSGSNNPVINERSSVLDAIVILTKLGLGAVSIVNEENKLVGILTDGDLRRAIEKNNNIFEVSLSELMNCRPVITRAEVPAIEALYLMEKRERQIMILPVVNSEYEPIGIIRLHDIVKAGISL